MKRYIVAVIILNVVLLVGLLFYPYKYERTYLSVEHIKNFYKIEQKPEIKTLILGNSVMAFGVRPLLLEKAFSLALPSSTNVNVWLELQRFLKVAKPPKCIVYSTSYIKEHFEVGFLKKHIGAQLYSWSEIDSIYMESKKANLEPFASMNSLHYWSEIFWLKNLYLTVYSQVQFKKWLAPFLYKGSDFERKRQATIHELGFLNSEILGKTLLSDRQDYLFQPFEVFPLDDHYFQKILEKTKSEGIKFIFVDMPIINENNDIRISEFSANHVRHVQSLMAVYGHTRLIQISFDKHKGDFFDANHLNTRGASKFTALLKPYIDKECE